MALPPISRLDPFERAIAVLVDDLTSAPARSARLAAFAREEIDRARAINRAALGGEAQYDVYVDGQRGASLAAVRPDGTVFAEWHLLEEALEWIGRQLVIASPVRRGTFSRSHILLVDGKEHEGEGPPPVGEEYVFVNTQPYARKIERGLSQQAPQGVYEVVSNMAHRRFGNIARVSFSFRAVTGTSALETWAQGTNLLKAGRRSMSNRERVEWLRRQPAIIVRSF